MTSSRTSGGGAFEEFLTAYPAYAQTRLLDELRVSEFARLDQGGHVYLDYAGGGVYADSQVRQHQELLRREMFGNPHSLNPASTLASELVERCRRRVLQFFNASPDEYGVIFTANASHALKLVGEAYPFTADAQLLLTVDNHNSVNGMREFARAAGARTTYVPISRPTLRVDDKTLDGYLARGRPQGQELFAYPAQSNFSGVQHPLEWIARAKACGWDVLLDAAAFVPTNRLDLSAWHPDFVAISFYKMFGYPTGIGALIARWSALGRLHRPWFAGGTVKMGSVKADRHTLAPGSAAFEDGTVNYTGIPAVEMGLDLLEAVGIDVVHERVRCLTGWMIDKLVLMRHSTGAPLVRLYGPSSVGAARGGIVALNLYDAHAKLIDHHLVEERAAARRISLRTGCFCNPGASETALAISHEGFDRCGQGETTGAVRISIGLATNFADVQALLAFARDLLQ